MVERTLEAAGTHDGSYRFQADPKAAVARAQAIYTDVWASMGQEEEAEERAKIFAPYQVNAELIGAAPAGVPSLWRDRA